MRPIDVEQISTLARPVVEGQGYELVDVEWKHEASLGCWVLRVFIDRPEEGGVSLDDCATISRELSAVLDVEDLISPAYNLEVSSPGLNRPLKREADFRRHIGQQARIRVRRPYHREAESAESAGSNDEGRRNFSGRLVAAEGGLVRIDVGDRTYAVSIADIEKANLIFDFAAAFRQEQAALSDRSERRSERPNKGQRAKASARVSQK